MSRTQQGFTLIEVLVVMLLVSVLITLVAPVGAKQVEKARAQTEYLELDRQISRLALDAFLRSDFVTLNAAGKELAWEFEEGGRGTVEFEQLFFDAEQQVTINPNGIADPQVLELLQRDRPRTIEIVP
jgi:prepilin-type N-terminal cleavage/methylation domain-containing protein